MRSKSRIAYLFCHSELMSTVFAKAEWRETGPRLYRSQVIAGKLVMERKMEAAGIAPASREASATASTCVADHLIVGVGAPFGKVPVGLSRHEFNPSCNRRLSSGDPALSSPAASRGQKPGAGPSLWFRQRDGDQHGCWQLRFWSAFNEAC